MKPIRIQFKKRLGEVDFDIDLTLPPHGITAIFGRSGAGKTSLINMVSGLVTPESGEITVNGRRLFSSQNRVSLPVEKRRIGYVFQEARLFPHYTVKGNLYYGIRQKDPDYFCSVVGLLALEPLLKRYPHDLSGGEKQRVAIARALLSKPDLLLMDEPLASLDLPRKKEVMPFLEQLTQQVKLPILYVTHSVNEILRLADHLVIIEQGKVCSAGTTEAVWASHHMYPWQSFSDQSSLFAARISAQNREFALTQVELAPEVTIWVQQTEGDAGTPVRLQIRSNDVSVSREKATRTSIRNILSAEIEAIEMQNAGEQRKSAGLKLKLADGCYLWATITEWALKDLALQTGDKVYAQIKAVSVSQRDIALTH